MPDPGYRFFDHTGDFGADVVARSEAEAVSLCARAFLDLLTDAPDTVQEREARRIDVTGVDRAAALVALGNELLFLFEVEKFLCARFAPTTIDDTRLAGVAHGERFDPARHPIARPVKRVSSASRAARSSRA